MRWPSSTAPGEQTLPGGCCLSAEPGISRVTVRRALNLLSREGCLLRQQGARQRAGASPDLPADAAAHTCRGRGACCANRARGSVPGHLRISRQTLLPTPAWAMSPVEAGFLDADPGAPLVIIRWRCCLADGRAVGLTGTRHNGAPYGFLTDIGRQAVHAGWVFVAYQTARQHPHECGGNHAGTS
ncbi:MAG: GntR family transcriptional regulator [Rhodobacterales bacterium]